MGELLMTWTSGWRERAWAELDRPWDLLVIGGGITGAGVFRQAADAGLRALLVDAGDFASGTSSRSSKLVHGGLRYLRTAQLRLTLESVREREYLLRAGRGLVTPQGFLYASLKGDHLPNWIFGLGLCAYDIMARQWQHRAYDPRAMQELCPSLNSHALQGGYRYFDAQTDDARLVLRLIREGVDLGALALNYTRVIDLLRTADGRVRGAVLEDRSGEIGQTIEVQAQVIVNATGVWVDQLRGLLDRPPRMRPLRGSHLVLPLERLPLNRAVTFLHPQDGRPVFAIPWEGAIVFGTTDIDHQGQLASNPAISRGEQDYLLSALQHAFPSRGLTEDDILATFSGLRPVVNTGRADPSKESREYAIWDDSCLITVAGGKLTTFRLMARDALKRACKHLPGSHYQRRRPALTPPPSEVASLVLEESFSPFQQTRLLSRYSGAVLSRMLTDGARNQEEIPGTPYTWGELGSLASQEAVVHLDDLLLRRLRLGLLLPKGGEVHLDRVGEIIRRELGWSMERWNQEAADYRDLIQRSYSRADGSAPPVILLQPQPAGSAVQ